jgi:hypothetical protein
MRFAAGALVLAAVWQASARVAPEPRHFRYERAIEIAPGATGPVCAALDGTLYAHSPGLTDIRLYAGGQEVPYALMTSQTEARSDAARVLNLGERGGHISFDLEMPSRAYSTVNLKLGGQDFLATAKVSGMQKLGDPATALGTFTLFDLTGQRLGRSTSLALPESNFPYLYIDLAVSAAPGHPGVSIGPEMVEGAKVPPSREAQTIYTTLAATNTVSNQGSASVATFDVPAHVPVERVSFAISPDDHTNFSRTVTVLGKFADDEEAIRRGEGEESIAGTISRVRLRSHGEEIAEEQLSVPAVFGLNVRRGMRVEVSVQNWDDKPLAIRAVKLEMRQRKLCFDSPGQPVTMFYGDEKLSPPVYDYARVFQPLDAAAGATLGAEMANPIFAARAEPRKTLTERHPEMVWAALLAVVGVLGFVAFRSAGRIPPSPH